MSKSATIESAVRVLNSGGVARIVVRMEGGRPCIPRADSVCRTDVEIGPQEAGRGENDDG